MKKLLVIGFIFFSTFVSQAQTHCSCDSAIIVTKEVTGPVSACGEPEAFYYRPHSQGSAFEKPESVTWFRIDIPYDTVLTFDIIPTNGRDDLDFLLFNDYACKDTSLSKTEKRDLCHQIKFFSLHKKMAWMKEIMPMRSNTANASQAAKGMTGLSTSATNEKEPPGKHPAYSKAIEVKKGERYYLAVENYSNESGSFTLKLHLRWPVVAPPRKPNLVPLSNKINLNIFICDSTGKPVSTRLKITSSYWRMDENNGDEIYGLGSASQTHKVTDTNNISHFILSAQHKQKIKISCIATGYMLNQSKITMPDIGTEFNDTVIMMPITEHKNMVFQDIEFEPDQPAFLPGAKEPLSNLLEFMQSNPAVKIIIKGYVNDPWNQNSNKFDQDLSEARARAVQEYLKKHGIDESRMEWVGYGNRDMLYPNAQTFEEQQANRRVEIEVK